jgi:hypothetical protein
VLLGDQKIESGSDSDAAGMAEAFKTAASASGTLATLSIYVSTTSSSTTLVAGLYASNAAGTHDGSASTRYDPLRDNNPNIIDLLYYDENDGTPGYFHHATLYDKTVALL